MLSAFHWRSFGRCSGFTTIVPPLVALGEQEEAAAIMERPTRRARSAYLRAEVLAMGYAALADRDAAFTSLQRARKAPSAGMIYLHLGPGYQPLRNDPRYATLVKKIRLPKGALHRRPRP